MSGASSVAQWVKNLPATWEIQEMWLCSLCWEVPLEEGMVTHSSILAWGIPWTEGPGRLQSMGLHRVRHAEETACMPALNTWWSYWTPKRGLEVPVLLEANRIHCLRQVTLPERSTTDLEIGRTAATIIIIKPGLYSASLYLFMSWIIYKIVTISCTDVVNGNLLLYHVFYNTLKGLFSIIK